MNLRSHRVNPRNPKTPRADVTIEAQAMDLTGTGLDAATPVLQLQQVERTYLTGEVEV